MGDITDYVKGFAFKSSDYEESGSRIIRVSDLGKNSIKKYSNPVFISEDQANQYIRYMINKNDILITTVGSKAEMKESAVGRPIIINDNSGYLLNQNLVKITGIKSINNYFIYMQLLQTRYFNFIAMIQRGNANQSNITIDDLWSFRISLTNEHEQKSIGLLFTYFDKLITLNQRHTKTPTFSN